MEACKFKREPEPAVELSLKKEVEEFFRVRGLELASHHEMYKSVSTYIVMASHLYCFCLCHEEADFFLWKIAVVGLIILCVDALAEVLNVLQGLL